MATKTSLKINGLDDYIQALANAGEDINKISREALAEAGDILAAEMKRNVRVVTGERSRNLVDHIKIRVPSGEGDYNYREIGIIHRLEFTDAATAIQANAVEYGSVHNKAMPFVRPAIRSKKAAINALIKARLVAAGLADA